MVGGVAPTRAGVDLAPLSTRCHPPDVELARLSSLAETEAMLREVGLL